MGRSAYNPLMDAEVYYSQSGLLRDEGWQGAGNYWWPPDGYSYSPHRRTLRGAYAEVTWRRATRRLRKSIDRLSRDLSRAMEPARKAAREMALVRPDAQRRALEDLARTRSRAVMPPATPPGKATPQECDARDGS